MNPSPSEDLKARVLAAARAQPSPARPRVLLLDALTLGGAALLLTGLFFSLGGVDVGRRPLPYLWGVGLGWGVAAAVGVWLALGRGKSMAGRPRGHLLAMAMATPALLFGWQLAWNLAYPEMGQACTGYHPFGAPCHQLIVAMAAVPFFAFAYVRRFSDAVHPHFAGAALAANGAVWAGLAVTLRCECTHPLHVGLGHVLPIVFAAIAGIGLGPWLLGLRRGR